jgi:hypothetical protein
MILLFQSDISGVLILRSSTFAGLTARPQPCHVPDVNHSLAWVHSPRQKERPDQVHFLVEQAIDRLADVGPSLGRPLVDTLEHSRLRNLKELRPGSRGRSEIRILFVFDPGRQAILLVVGDKAGRWSHWYEEAIPLAERRYADWLAGRYEEGDR